MSKIGTDLAEENKEQETYVETKNKGYVGCEVEIFVRRKEEQREYKQGKEAGMEMKRGQTRGVR